MSDKFTPLHVEAACCIWEALLDVRLRTDIPDDTCKAIRYAFEQRGTSEMRHAAIALSVVCSEVWHKLDEDERDTLLFDWEFVPRFVGCLRWDAQRATVVEIPNVKEALALYRARPPVSETICNHRDNGRGICCDCGTPL